MAYPPAAAVSARHSHSQREMKSVAGLAVSGSGTRPHPHSKEQMPPSRVRTGRVRWWWLQWLSRGHSVARCSASAVDPLLPATPLDFDHTHYSQVTHYAPVREGHISAITRCPKGRTATNPQLFQLI